MIMKLKELMPMKNVFFTAHFIETEFSWLSARCFCMRKLLSREETNFFRIDGREKSSPAFLPNPSSQHILRYYSSLRKHCHLFPHVYAIEASLEWKVIDLCQWRTLPTHIKLLGKWNKTKHWEVKICSVKEYTSSNIQQLSGYNSVRLPSQHNGTGTSEILRFQIVFGFKCFWRAEKHFSYYPWLMPHPHTYVGLTLLSEFCG